MKYFSFSKIYRHEENNTKHLKSDQQIILFFVNILPGEKNQKTFNIIISKINSFLHYLKRIIKLNYVLLYIKFF